MTGAEAGFWGADPQLTGVGRVYPHGMRSQSTLNPGPPAAGSSPYGRHLLIELDGARFLDDTAVIERALRLAASACGATLLAIHSHHFGRSGGVTAVAMLAESHITIHTWPECGYAAVDIFLCGEPDPRRALDVLQRELAAERVHVVQAARGPVPEE